VPVPVPVPPVLVQPDPLPDFPPDGLLDADGEADLDLPVLGVGDGVALADDDGDGLGVVVAVAVVRRSASTSVPAVPSTPMAAAARQVPLDLGVEDAEGELLAVAETVVRFVCALVSASCAVDTVLLALVSSMRASTSPTVTWSPGRTRTAVTVPAMLKASPRLCAGCNVPAAATAAVTTPRCTCTVAGGAVWRWLPLVS
jgi:hypothetical protein